MRKNETLFRAVLTLVMALTLGTAAAIGHGSIARAVTIDCSPATPAAAPAAATPLAVPAADATFPDGGGELTVFAAASLSDSFTKMKADLEAAHPGLTITFNFAGS